MQLITQWNADIQQISKVSVENNDERLLPKKAHKMLVKAC